MSRRYVNVYLQDLAYGGPEEGGWWYDTAYPLSHSEIGSSAWGADELPPKGYAHAEYHTIEHLGELASYRATPSRIKRLKAWAERHNQGRRDISSVLSEGRFLVLVEKHRARHRPDGRPHYE